MSSLNKSEPGQIRGRPTIAEIDLGNLTANFHTIRDFIGKDVKFMAVVKANAYGHGAVECASALQNAGVDWLGVALVEEALELREAGISTSILCFGGAWPDQGQAVIEKDITPVALTIEMAEKLNAAAEKYDRNLNVHIKIDTGMGRVGVSVEELPEFLNRLSAFPFLQIDGVMTHFAAADDLSASDFTHSQIAKFHDAVEIVRSKGHDPTWLDMANSPGAVAFPSGRDNLVRIGGILYGLGGDVLPKGIPAPHLLPVMSLKTKIAVIKSVPAETPLGYGKTFVTERSSRIATIPIGYNDGYPRSLSNQGSALLRGVQVPVAGRISMDWTILDVTDVPDAELGDEVVLVGQSGSEIIRAEDLARESETISYEITCGIGPRVPRHYFKNT